MDEVRDLEVISIPFAFAAMVCQFLGWQYNMFFLIMVAVAALFAIECPSRTIPLAALFFFLGLFCGSCAESCEAFWDCVRQLPPATKAVCWLRHTIDNIPFRDSTNTALVKALLTGDRSGLSRDTVQIFRDAGASHILALSGLHLGFIHLVIRRLTAVLGNTPLSRGFRAMLTTSAAGFYTLMTGASPSTVRAMLFIYLSEWSSLSTFRQGCPQRSLLLALTIQIALSPEAAMTAGFQLSYLAMCGIVFLYPAMKAWYPDGGKLAAVDPMRRIWNAAALSISCQIFTAPLAWTLFGTFPKYFLLTNVLILPLTSATMAVSLTAVAATAAGHSPEMLTNVAEWLINTMKGSLDIICRI